MRSPPLVAMITSLAVGSLPQCSARSFLGNAEAIPRAVVEEVDPEREGVLDRVLAFLQVGGTPVAAKAQVPNAIAET